MSVVTICRTRAFMLVTTALKFRRMSPFAFSLMTQGPHPRHVRVFAHDAGTAPMADVLEALHWTQWQFQSNTHT